MRRPESAWSSISYANIRNPKSNRPRWALPNKERRLKPIQKPESKIQKPNPKSTRQILDFGCANKIELRFGRVPSAWPLFESTNGPPVFSEIGQEIYRKLQFWWFCWIGSLSNGGFSRLEGFPGTRCKSLRPPAVSHHCQSPWTTQGHLGRRWNVTRSEQCMCTDLKQQSVPGCNGLHSTFCNCPAISSENSLRSQSPHRHAAEWVTAVRTQRLHAHTNIEYMAKRIPIDVSAVFPYAKYAKSCILENAILTWGVHVFPQQHEAFGTSFNQTIQVSLTMSFSWCSNEVTLFLYDKNRCDGLHWLHSICFVVIQIISHEYRSYSGAPPRWRRSEIPWLVAALHSASSTNVRQTIHVLQRKRYEKFTIVTASFKD